VVGATAGGAIGLGFGLKWYDLSVVNGGAEVCEGGVWRIETQ
jgi:hypothetical protein